MGHRRPSAPHAASCQLPAACLHPAPAPCTCTWVSLPYTPEKGVWVGRPQAMKAVAVDFETGFGVRGASRNSNRNRNTATPQQEQQQQAVGCETETAGMGMAQFAAASPDGPAMWLRLAIMPIAMWLEKKLKIACVLTTAINMVQ